MTSNLSLKKQQMASVLKNRSNGKSRSECAKIAKIPLSRINHWYKEGRQGFGTENINFYRNLKAIEEKLELERKYSSEIKEFSFPKNINARKQFINHIKNGLTRKEASKRASLDLKLITKWQSLGKKKIKPFYRFHKEYTDARKTAERNNELKKLKIKNSTVSLIKKGYTLEKAAKLVENGEYEKTIINWYNAGRLGDKNHKKFYEDCQKYIKPPVNTDIFAPLPSKWKEYFKKLPMNKTGIAWVNKVGNNWIYSRQAKTKSVSISDPNIRNLHKKVIKQGQIWGIRDMSLARPIINSNQMPPAKTPQKNIVTVRYTRLNKKEFKATVNGTIEKNQYSSILKKLEFYQPDMEKTSAKKVNGKTKINMEFKLDTSLLNSFKSKVKSLGWKNIN